MARAAAKTAARAGSQAAEAGESPPPPTVAEAIEVAAETVAAIIDRELAGLPLTPELRAAKLRILIAYEKSRRDLLADYLTREQAAAALGVAANTLRDWAHRGVGPAGFLIGRETYYRRATVAAWIDAQARYKEDAAARKAAEKTGRGSASAGRASADRGRR